MAIDFDQWDKEFGGEQAVSETKEAAKNEFRDVPDGTYTCDLEKLELGESKAGKPMIKGMFRIVDGEYNKQCLFVNQVITPGFPLHKGLEFLRSLDALDESEIDFDGSFRTFNDLLLDIAEEAQGMRYDVQKSQDGDFSRLEVVDAFEK